MKGAPERATVMASVVTNRFCPLCDAYSGLEWCATHGVPTLSLDTSRTPAKLEVGVVIAGRYRIDGLLSQGGMGALLLARQLDVDRRVVVKVLKGQRVTELAHVRRFYQECRVASSLRHPNIVEIFEFGVDEATRAPFLAMEFVEGRTLRDLVADEGPLGERRTALIFGQIAWALSAAHQKSVLHRDLKPSNIMVTPTPSGDRVKVLDFGLAKILEGDNETAPLTMPGKTVGTPAFMSPEQVSQRPQDFRTDLYGLGCMLFATLTGSPPFSGDDLLDVMRKQMREPPPPLPGLLADGRPPSAELEALHRSLLRKNKLERPGSTEEVAQNFEALAARAAPSFDSLTEMPAMPNNGATEPSSGSYDRWLANQETRVEARPRAMQDTPSVDTVAPKEARRPSVEVDRDFAEPELPSEVLARRRPKDESVTQGQDEATATVRQVAPPMVTQVVASTPDPSDSGLISPEFSRPSLSHLDQIFANDIESLPDTEVRARAESSLPTEPRPVAEDSEEYTAIVPSSLPDPADETIDRTSVLPENPPLIKPVPQASPKVAILLVILAAIMAGAAWWGWF